MDVLQGLREANSSAKAPSFTADGAHREFDSSIDAQNTFPHHDPSSSCISVVSVARLVILESQHVWLASTSLFAFHIHLFTQHIIPVT